MARRCGVAVLLGTYLSQTVTASLVSELAEAGTDEVYHRVVTNIGILPLDVSINPASFLFFTHCFLAVN